MEAVQREAIRTFRERCANDGPPADGLVYYGIRYYQGFLGGYRNEVAEKDAWALLLHRPRSRKADYLTQLLKHGSFPQAFDALMAIRGLAADLSIGNMHSMIALRCDEVMYNLSFGQRGAVSVNFAGGNRGFYATYNVCVRRGHS